MCNFLHYLLVQFVGLRFTKYYQDDESRKMMWEGHVACMGEIRNGYKILIGKPEKKRPLGRPRRGV
jgi:hypothetical protein